MAAVPAVAAPAGALALGVVGVALWVAGLPWRWLDPLVALLCAAGLVVAALGYARRGEARARRLAVVALGWNVVALVALAVAYAAG